LNDKRKEKTELRVENPASWSTCPPQTPHWIYWDYNRGWEGVEYPLEIHTS